MSDTKKFIQSVLSNKNKSKVTLTQLNQAIQQATAIATINDKGIFIVTVSELLYRLFYNYSFSLRKFVSQIDSTQKLAKPRNQDDVKTKKRRPIKKDVLGNGANIQQISNESLSNPSNVEQPRITEERRLALQRSEQISNGIKSNKSSENDSKGSKDNTFKNQLNKISEEVRAGQETYLTDQQNYEGMNIIDDGSESSNSFGIINNLAEKMKIFGSEVAQERATATRRKGTATRKKYNATTKKKHLGRILDQNTTLEETRISITDTLNDSKISYEFVEAVDLYENFNHQICYNEVINISDLFTEHNLNKLKVYGGLIESQDTYINNEPFNPSYEMTLPIPDYTMSQPTSFPRQQQTLKDKIPVEIFSNNKMSINSLSDKINKDKSSVFYEMLWRCQNEEVQLQQRSAQQFSDIFITTISF